MPTVSAFYGIVIAMYFNDHEPPHVHARYAEHHATVSIATAEVLTGSLPTGGQRLVREWVDVHRDELEENWRLARELQPLVPIEPLP